MRDEIAEQLELAGGERHAASGTGHQPLPQPHRHVAEAELLAAGGVPVVAPHLGADAREQLADAERLAHVIIGPQIESAHPIALVRARGEHDDRHMRANAAQALAYFEAAHAGQHDVHQQQRKRLRAKHRHGFLARRDGGHAIALVFEVIGEHGAHARLVFDHQHVVRVVSARDVHHDAALDGSAGSRALLIRSDRSSGSVMVKVLPRPGALATSTVPRWAWINSFTSGSPSPNPGRWSRTADRTARKCVCGRAARCPHRGR